MPHPYANTCFYLPGANIFTVRSDIGAMLERLTEDQIALRFGSDAHQVVSGNYTITAHAADLPGGGGIAEVHVIRLDLELKTRRVARWYLAQANAFGPVEVNLQGEVPLNWDIESPRNWQPSMDLLRRWASAYGMHDNEKRALGRPMHVGTDAELDQLAALIKSPGRRHAVVVLSEDAGGYYATDVDDIVGYLPGYAHVRTLPDHLGRDLGALLGGKDYSVYGAAVRLFSPHYRPRQRHDLFNRNPRFSAAQILAAAADGQLYDLIFEGVQGLQARRFTRLEPTFSKVRNRANAAAAETMSTEVTTLQRELVKVQAAYADLRRVADDLRSNNASLQSEVEAFRRQLNEHEQQSLQELLLDRFGEHDYVELWGTAYDSAEGINSGGYTRSKVSYAFDVIEEYAAALAKHDFQRLGMTHEQFFKQNRNIEYKQESVTTMGHHGGARSFTHEGETREVAGHFTLNPGGDYCVQLYFDFDRIRRRVNLVYCGRHLAYGN